MSELDGSYKVQFGYLASYAAALKRTNPRTSSEIDLCKESLKEGKRVFQRMFIYFDALKKGQKCGCTPLKCGYFLKGVCKGQLLTAMGVDACDQMYPIAQAVINKENKANWRWFLEWIKKELDLKDGSELTVISDMQKVRLQYIFQLNYLI